MVAALRLSLALSVTAERGTIASTALERGSLFSEFNRLGILEEQFYATTSHFYLHARATIRVDSGKRKACCCKRAKFFLLADSPFIRNSSTCNRPLTRGR
jgi:hypothetical protein